MRFLETFIAVLLAMWLTGNVQAGSLLMSVIATLGYVVIVIAAIVLAAIVIWNCDNPRKIWNDFRTGRFRF